MSGLIPACCLLKSQLLNERHLSFVKIYKAFALFLWQHYITKQMSSPLRGCELKYYNTSACDISIPAEKPFLSVTKTEDFINFLLRFYKLYVRGISPGILLLPQNGWGCRRMSTPKTGIFDGSRGSQQQNIFVNQRKINSE